MMERVARCFDPPPKLPEWSEHQTLPEHVNGAIQHYLAYHRGEGEEHSEEATRHWNCVRSGSAELVTLRNLGLFLLFASCTLAAPRTLVLSGVASIALFRVTGPTGESVAEWLDRLPQETRDLWLKLGLIFSAMTLSLKPSSPQIVLTIAVGLSVGPRTVDA